jgi:hypothetical protein
MGRIGGRSQTTISIYRVAQKSLDREKIEYLPLLSTTIDLNKKILLFHR